MTTEDKGGNQLPSKAKRVEVLVDNLGPDLLKKGTVTDDPKIVALLKRKSNPPLVREVTEQ
jgi:hypothetical protein